MISFTSHARQRAAERGLTGKNLVMAMRAIAKHGNRDGLYVTQTGHHVIVRNGAVLTVTPHSNTRGDSRLHVYKL